MLICLNPRAGFGRSARRWSRLQPQLSNLAEYVVEETGQGFDAALSQHLRRGERFIVAAGGDGTVHQVVNCLLALPERERESVCLGALALGSSNDFHQPRNTSRMLAGVYSRIERRLAIAHNVVQCVWENAGHARTEHFIANASLGVVADANRVYDRSRGLVALLKRLSIDLAIGYCAVSTLFRAPNRRLRIAVDGAWSEHVVSNLGVLLNPYFAGGLRYDTPIDVTGPQMCVQLCENMSRWRKLRTFAALARGKFRGLPGTRNWWCQSLRVEADEPFVLEMDGELREMTSVEMTLRKGALLVCQ